MAGNLSPSRMEAFSDGVIAVIITIMVLEIHVPAREISNLDGLHRLAPILFVYLLSFVQVGIYWINHHYLTDEIPHVSHGILWSNLAVLFLLSLFPAATAWVGERGFNSFSMCLYSVVSFLPGIAWTVMTAILCKHFNVQPSSSKRKLAFSTGSYLAAIFLAWISPWLSLAVIVAVAIVWLIPPRTVVERTREYMSHPDGK